MYIEIYFCNGDAKRYEATNFRFENSLFILDLSNNKRLYIPFSNVLEVVENKTKEEILNYKQIKLTPTEERLREEEIMKLIGRNK